jgi:hypothetical protein
LLILGQSNEQNIPKARGEGICAIKISVNDQGAPVKIISCPPPPQSRNVGAEPQLRPQLGR